ncbi:MAG: hypothetical protein KDG51_07275, partial [Calditrichaeota bacterium]|nr:hypothetical protein [Calditrichota bacterium]
MKIRSTLVIVIMLLAGAAAMAAAFSPEEPQDRAQTAYQDAYNLILDEKWSEAITAFDNLLGQYPKSGWVDDARFWRCYANEKLDKSL